MRKIVRYIEEVDHHGADREWHGAPVNLLRRFVATRHRIYRNNSALTFVRRFGAPCAVTDEKLIIDAINNLQKTFPLFGSI